MQGVDLGEIIRELEHVTDFLDTEPGKAQLHRAMAAEDKAYRVIEVVRLVRMAEAFSLEASDG